MMLREKKESRRCEGEAVFMSTKGANRTSVLANCPKRAVRWRLETSAAGRHTHLSKIRTCSLYLHSCAISKSVCRSMMGGHHSLLTMTMSIRIHVHKTDGDFACDEPVEFRPLQLYLILPRVVKTSR